MQADRALRPNSLLKFVSDMAHSPRMLKVILLNVMASIPILTLVVAYVMPTYEARYTVDRTESTRIAVESVFNSLSYYESQVRSGAMSLTNAQAAAKDLIKSMRYNGSEYFWIHDSSLHMVMHPIKAELDGKDISDFKDPNGKRLFVEMVKVCQEHGEGTVDYLWAKPGNDLPVRKTSYVKYFKAWDWIVGNGVYLDDIEANLKVFKTRLYTLLAACLALSLLISILSGVYFARSTLNAVQIVSSEVSAEVTKLTDSSASINESASKLFESATQQSAAIEVTAASMEEIGSMLAQTTKHTEATLSAAESGKKEAGHGKEVVLEMVKAMDEIRLSNERLQTIAKTIEDIKSKTAVINDIAFETRLLSFNASIEAARAGSHGRGFAVVAEEVGKLAMFSNKAADEVKQLLDGSTSRVSEIMVDTKARVEKGHRTSLECESAFDKMEQSLAHIASSVAMITTATREQVAGVRQTNSAMVEMEKSTQVNSRNATNLSGQSSKLIEAARSLSVSTEKMQVLISGRSLSPDVSQPLPARRAETTPAPSSAADPVAASNPVAAAKGNEPSDVSRNDSRWRSAG